MTLDQWLDMNGIKARWFAGRIGVTEQTISRLRRGHHKPTLELQQLIEQETGGAVKAKDFLGEAAR